ncbi:hypothetical protein Q3G72_011740 [Acer saccharum]|nr:hypothetical protein Q3G72_011740 [Acer saccharum]
MVSGMHVYGWPISAKLVEYGWNSRRSATEGRKGEGKGGGPAFVTGQYLQEGIRNDRDARRVEKVVNWGQVNRSFVEAVKKNMPESNVNRTVSIENEPVMSWFGSTGEGDWLNRTAVGKLKEFKKIELVNQKLESRGFKFCSAYLGGRSVAWTFDTVCDRDGFINNGFFWRDCFSSMSRKMETSTGLSKLTWVDVYGVPIYCWCNEFFMRLGGQVGEVVWVEEDTSKRDKMDRGRILLRVPVGEKISREFKVEGVHGVFSVRLEEDPVQVAIYWVNQFLGFKPPKTMATSSKTTSTKFEKVGEVRGMSDDRDFHAGSKKDRLEDLVNVRDKVGDNRKPHKSGNGADGKKSTFDFLSQTTLTILRSKVVRTRGRVDRGKSKSIYKVKLKSCWFPICNKGVRIGNKKIQNVVLTSSSSGSELGFGAGPLLYKRECSKVIEVQGPTNQVYIGPISTLNNSPGAKRKYRADEVDDRANLNSEQI